jgi:hypothetical protein
LGLIRRIGDHRETLVVLAVALVTLALAAGELYGHTLVVFAAQHCASPARAPNGQAPRICRAGLAQGRRAQGL